MRILSHAIGEALQPSNFCGNIALVWLPAAQRLRTFKRCKWIICYRCVPYSHANREVQHLPHLSFQAFHGHVDWTVCRREYPFHNNTQTLECISISWYDTGNSKSNSNFYWRGHRLAGSANIPPGFLISCVNGRAGYFLYGTPPRTVNIEEKWRRSYRKRCHISTRGNDKNNIGIFWSS
jgi:hypothetical protein